LTTPVPREPTPIIAQFFKISQPIAPEPTQKYRSCLNLCQGVRVLGGFRD
jgi:hypothetical protein